MVCKRCGRYNPDYKEVCMYCGLHFEKNDNQNNFYSEKFYKPVEQPVERSNNSKLLLGIIMSIIFGLLGLIIGLLLYPANTEERETFLRGWLIGLLISFCIAVIFAVVCCATIFRI